MIPTYTYEISDTREMMHNLVRESCTDSEQHLEKTGKKCAGPGRSVVRSLMFFAASTRPACGPITRPGFYSTPRQLETSATTGKLTMATRSNQLFIAFSAHTTDRTPPFTALQ
jgi:hypothetical protein